MLKGSLIEPHAHDCWYRKRSMRQRATWVCPEHNRVKPIGHKAYKSMWVFRCNCTNCPAKLGVTTEAMYALWEREMAHLQNKGFSRARGQGATEEK